MYALLQRFCPVGDADAEGGFDFALVEHGVAGALHGRGVLVAVAGLDIACGVAAVGGYHLREVVPRANAFVAVVVDALLRALQCGDDGLRQVERVGRGTALVEHHLELRLGGRQI